MKTSKTTPLGRTGIRHINKKNSKGEDIRIIVAPTLANLRDALVDLTGKYPLEDMTWNGWDDGSIIVYGGKPRLFFIEPEDK